MSTVFVFTGQGVQQVGMGKDLYDAYPEQRKIFTKIDSILSREISALCFKGPYEKLIDANAAGLAVFTLSAVINEILKQSLIQPSAYAGYSVGQYSALYASGALSLEDATCVVNRRGQCLKKAAKESNSGMLGVIGLTAEQIQLIIEPLGKAYISNYNSPTTLTVSYDLSLKEQLYQALEAAEAIKVADIPVEGGWHSEFMKPAAESFRPCLESLDLRMPGGIFIDNFTAEIPDSVDTLKQNLYYHVFHPVKWYQSVKKLIELGSDTFVEIGFGNQLSKFIKYTSRKVTTLQTGTAEELSRTIAFLKR
jgi:[acyl-carrier-protein] S-malonyltransferase